MKKVITILLIQSIIIIHGFAQTSQTSISGRVVDDKNNPVEAATISLMKAEDSSVIKLSVTDKVGKFSFQNIPLGSHYINASAVNYARQHSSVFELNNNSLTKDVDAIVLQPEIRTLSAVTVSGNVSAADIAESSGYPQVDKDALRVIKESPEWKPAVQFNQPVNAYRIQPFIYQLKDEKDNAGKKKQ